MFAMRCVICYSFNVVVSNVEFVMLHRVFSVYDSKAGAHLQPFFSPTKGTAVRSITELVRDEKHQFGKYPSDYTLFYLGEFEDTMGKFTLQPAPASLGVLVEFLEDK